MAKKTTVSIGKKFKKSIDKHKGSETKYGPIDLPPGIKDGVAQLNDIKFAKYAKGPNKGKDYFIANGIVFEPVEVTTDEGKVIPVKGQRTQIMIQLCDRKNDKGEVTKEEDEFIDEMLNEVKKLGVDLSEIDAEDLDSVLEALKEEAPFFAFSTSQSKPTPQFPNPRVWENWNGCRGLEDYSPDVEDNVEEDEEEAEDEDVEEDEEVEEDVEDEGSDEEETEGVDVNRSDLDELAAFADDDGDEDAASVLTEIAEHFEIDPNEYEHWAGVAEAIEEAREGGEAEAEEEEEEEDEEEEIEPEKEEVYWYKPPRKKKAIECEVTAVFKAKQTVNLRSLEDETPFKGVPWAKLQTEE